MYMVLVHVGFALRSFLEDMVVGARILSFHPAKSSCLLLFFSRCRGLCMDTLTSFGLIYFQFSFWDVEFIIEWLMLCSFYLILVTYYNMSYYYYLHLSSPRNYQHFSYVTFAYAFTIPWLGLMFSNVFSKKKFHLLFSNEVISKKRLSFSQS